MFKHHYANRPYSDDVYTVAGMLDIKCGWIMSLLKPLLMLLRGVPPISEREVPVSVRFESRPDTADFHFNRTFRFKGREPYVFHSRMVHRGGHLVDEVMPFGVVWRSHYSWQKDRVVLAHRGYGLRLFGKTIPVPLGLLMGKGHAEEIATSDTSYRMHVQMTHPLFGVMYDYKGSFQIETGVVP